jgi:hypothetical protein
MLIFDMDSKLMKKKKKTARRERLKGPAYFGYHVKKSYSPNARSPNAKMQ